MRMISNLMDTVRNAIRNWEWRSRKTAIIAIAIIGIVFVLTRALGGGTSDVSVNEGPRQVVVARIADLVNGSAHISVVGEVESKSEAVIRTEAGGRVTRVHASLGDTVSAGRILAEMENSSQRAAVLQAEGAYEAAEAALGKIRGGTREEQLSILQTAFESAQSTAVTAIFSAYASADSAVTDTTDQMFSNPESPVPHFNLSTSNSQAKIDIENTRPQLSQILSRQKASAPALSASSDIGAELEKAEGELRIVRAFLDRLITALNGAIPSSSISEATIATYKSEAAGARTAITASLSGLSGAKAALETAEQNLKQGTTGAQSEDVAAVEAALKQAQGTYNAALANLEKTIIRSPISGTLNNFTVKLGDHLQPTQEVAVVSNNGTLEIVAYVTEEEKAQLAVGNAVRIEGTMNGVVTRIAPALDPISRRIEIRIGLSASADSLTNGRAVRVEIDRSKPRTEAQMTGPIAIPITALKIEADRTIVFIVENDHLVAKDIKISKLSGDSVRVETGLTADMEIVIDARGLNEGDEVAVTR